MNKLSLTRVLRLAVALVLLVVTAVIFFYFLSHRRPRTATVLNQEEIPAQKVEKQEGIEHFDFKGDRVIRAKAERHYAGEDGRYYMEGNVEIQSLAYYTFFPKRRGNRSLWEESVVCQGLGGGLPRRGWEAPIPGPDRVVPSLFLYEGQLAADDGPGGRLFLREDKREGPEDGLFFPVEHRPPRGRSRG